MGIITLERWMLQDILCTKPIARFAPARIRAVWRALRSDLRLVFRVPAGILAKHPLFRHANSHSILPILTS